LGRLIPDEKPKHFGGACGKISSSSSFPHEQLSFIFKLVTLRKDCHSSDSNLSDSFWFLEPHPRGYARIYTIEPDNNL
jgi:hypothetical protein